MATKLVLANLLKLYWPPEADSEEQLEQPLSPNFVLVPSSRAKRPTIVRLADSLWSRRSWRVDPPHERAKPNALTIPKKKTKARVIFSKD